VKILLINLPFLQCFCVCFFVQIEQDSKKSTNDSKNRNRKPLKDQAKMSYKLVYTDENG